MNDKELIDLIVQIWIANGGDSLGFAYCYDKILTAIQEKQTEDNPAKRSWLHG